MKKNYISLNHLQVMILMIEIQKLRDTIPNFYDGIAESFEQSIITQAATMSKHSKLQNLFHQYQISKSMIEYIIRLVEINILDPNILKEMEQKSLKDHHIRKR